MGVVDTSHVFAVYIANLTDCVRSEATYVAITDSALRDRLLNVLRIRDQQELDLFDDSSVVRVRFAASEQKNKRLLLFLILNTTPITKNYPQITVCIPLLKKSSFEAALYSAQVLGATRIIPIISEKMHKSWWQDGVHSRLKRILIAAAEQSKNYSLAWIDQPTMLQDAVLLAKPEFSYNIFFDPVGDPLLELLTDVVSKKPSAITLFWGPEGDCSASEKTLLKESKVRFVCLGRSILRAEDAILLGLGAIRSL